MNRPRLLDQIHAANLSLCHELFQLDDPHNQSVDVTHKALADVRIRQVVSRYLEHIYRQAMMDTRTVSAFS